MNQFPHLDKKLQYDFYMHGIPKQKGYSAWAKKQALEIPQEHLDFVCEALGVSMKRALELFDLIGSDAIKKEIEKRGEK